MGCALSALICCCMSLVGVGYVLGMCWVYNGVFCLRWYVLYVYGYVLDLFWLCFVVCFVCAYMCWYLVDMFLISVGYDCCTGWRVLFLRRYALVCFRYVSDMFWVCAGACFVCAGTC